MVAMAQLEDSIPLYLGDCLSSPLVLLDGEGYFLVVIKTSTDSTTRGELGR